MLRALAQSGPQTPVIEVMDRDVPTVNRRAPLSEAIEKLQLGRHPAIVVVDDAGQVTGIITLENLAEFMLVKQASASWRGMLGNKRQAGRT